MFVELPISCRAPLLWFLLPFILGICLLGYLSCFSPLIYLFLCILFLSISIFARRKWVALCFFVFASIFFGTAYWGLQKDIFPEDWSELPPRELSLKLRIDHLYASPNQYGNYSGEAQIIDCDPIIHELLAYKVVYSLALKEDSILPLRSGEYLVKGCLSTLPAYEEASDFERYVLSKAIYFRFHQGYFVEQVKEANLFYSFCNLLSDRAESILSKGLEFKDNEAAMYTAILLGRRKCLSDEQKNLFLSTGIMHLFSVSGLHVVAAAGVLLSGAKFLRIPYRFRDLPVLIILFLYVQLSGASPASVRAFSMVFIYLLMRIFWRKPEAFPVLVLSATLVLLLEPWQVWNAGFQLSYAVASGILLYGVPLTRDLKPLCRVNQLLLVRFSSRFLQKSIDCLLALLCVSLGASLLSLPLAIEHFSTFTPGGILLNISLVPFASFVVSLGLFSLLFGFLGLGFISVIFNKLGAFVVSLIHFQAETAFSWPYLFFKVQALPFENFGIYICLSLLFFLAFFYRPLSEQRFWPYYVSYIFLFISCLFLELQ